MDSENGSMWMMIDDDDDMHENHVLGFENSSNDYCYSKSLSITAAISSRNEAHKERLRLQHPIAHRSPLHT